MLGAGARRQPYQRMGCVMDAVRNPADPPPGGESVNKAWLRALVLTARIERAPERILPQVVEEQALARPGAPALLGKDAQLTYLDLARAMRRYARWALAQGLGKGDVVALMAHNHPAYMAAWLGLSSVGVVVALINTNLRGDALAHCLQAASPAQLLATPEFADAARTAAARLAKPPQIRVLGEGGMAH